MNDSIFEMEGGNPYLLDYETSFSGGGSETDDFNNIDTDLLYYIVYLLDPINRSKIETPGFNELKNLPEKLTPEQSNIISNNKYNNKHGFYIF